MVRPVAPGRRSAGIRPRLNKRSALPQAFHRPLSYRDKLLPVLRRFASHFPSPVYRGLQAAYAEWRKPRIEKSGCAEARTHNIAVTAERVLLHCCETKLSFAKAHRELGYSPIVSFEEGCQRSVSWLAFAGYPVRKLIGERRAEGIEYQFKEWIAGRIE